MSDLKVRPPKKATLLRTLHSSFPAFGQLRMKKKAAILAEVRGRFARNFVRLALHLTARVSPARSPVKEKR